MVATNQAPTTIKGTTKIGIYSHGSKYHYVNGFTGLTKNMGGGSNSVKLADIVKAGIKNKISA